MATKHSTSGKPSGDTTRTDYRADYIVLGVDDRDRQHVWDRQTNTVHIIHEGGGRGRRHLNAGDINDYCQAVADAIGWQSRRLHETFADQFNAQVSIE